MKEKTLIAATDIVNIPIGNLSKFEIKRLYEYLLDANKRFEEAKRLKDWLHAAIALKYNPYIDAKRRRLEKDSGIIHLEEQNFKISNDVAKKVEWRQDILSRVVADLIVRGSNVFDYVETTYHIPEVTYEALPEYIKYKLNAARVIRLEDIKNGVGLNKCRGINEEQFRAADRLVCNYERAFTSNGCSSVIIVQNIKQIKSSYNTSKLESQIDALHNHKLVFSRLNKKSQEIIEHFCLNELPIGQFELKQIPQWIKGTGTSRLREALDDLAEIYKNLPR